MKSETAKRRPKGVPAWGYKRCALCGEWKRRKTEFHRDPYQPGGCHQYCKPCKAEMDGILYRQWYEKNREYKVLWMREYRKRKREEREAAKLAALNPPLPKEKTLVERLREKIQKGKE